MSPNILKLYSCKFNSTVPSWNLHQFNRKIRFQLLNISMTDENILPRYLISTSFFTPCTYGEPSLACIQWTIKFAIKCSIFIILEYASIIACTQIWTLSTEHEVIRVIAIINSPHEIILGIIETLSRYEWFRRTFRTTTDGCKNGSYLLKMGTHDDNGLFQDNIVTGQGTLRCFPIKKRVSNWRQWKIFDDVLFLAL